MSSKLTGTETPSICHKCKDVIKEGEGKPYINHPNDDSFEPTWFHHKCFNRYEHYYGLDRPLD